MNELKSETKNGPSIARRKIIKTGTIVRAYSPSGHYWRDNLSLPSALYINKEDLIFSACHFDENQHKGAFYTEFDQPMIEKVRLLTALILPIGYNYGTVLPYPLYHSCRIDSRADLREFVISKEIIDSMSSSFTEKNLLARKDGPYPPKFWGPKYKFRDQNSPVALQKKIFDAIDLQDSVLMRGLSCLVKSSTLSCPPL